MWNKRNLTESPIMWMPNEQSGKLLKRFKKTIEDKYKISLSKYYDFHKWSIENISEFWSEIFDFFGVICSQRFHKVIDLNVPMSESPVWFEGAKLNYAENLLRYRDDQVALILAGEDRTIEKISYSDLYKEAELYAAAFKKFGLKKNDIVFCYMSNRKEAVFAMLAVVSIGAIWTGALPLLGPEAVINRFKQVDAKVLLTVDRFMQQGEEIDMIAKLQTIASALPSLEKVIIVPSKIESSFKDISGIKKSCFLDEFLKLGRLEDGCVPAMQFEQVPFNHPVFISYTSGTTGLPKAMLHGCGVLLFTCEFYALHSNAERESVWFSVSPVGWATWIGFSSLLFLGYTVVLYEGSPYFISPTYLWDLVDELKISSLFLPCSVVDELQKRGYTPQKKHSLSSLKTIMAGGSVMKSQNYDFIYEKVKKDVFLATGYGCTEMMGVSVNDPTLPVRKGEMSAVLLGTHLQCVDDSGNPVIGEMGDLVVAKPVPFLTLGLWGDTDCSIFREKYFSKYAGKFSLGDNGIINPVTEGLIICGRSDETLKQRGCRFGSSEIYNVVEKFPEIHDSLCVSQYNREMDERAVLFLIIRDGHSFSLQLVSRIREAIARELTIRHIPDVILETKDIPYNMNGKKMEILVKKMINRMPCNTDTVKNQESLEFYRNIPELQSCF